MYQEISQLLMYGDIDENEILYQMGQLFARFERGGYDKMELVRDINTQVKRILKVATDYDVALELNGKRIFLTDEQVLMMAESKVKLVANSDAHDENRVGEVSVPFATLQRLGIPLTRLTNYQGLLF